MAKNGRISYARLQLHDRRAPRPSLTTHHRRLRARLDAASRAAHHPGHRGSIDISSQLPFEHTSISLWKSLRSDQDYAYAPGGHCFAMTRASNTDMHRVGCFLHVRPLACSGTLETGSTPLPALPPVRSG
jgi:hypothetical protein